MIPNQQRCLILQERYMCESKAISTKNKRYYKKYVTSTEIRFPGDLNLLFSTQQSLAFEELDIPTSGTNGVNFSQVL